MGIERKCACCGKTFVARSGSQKYCSVVCADEAKRQQKKRRKELMDGIEPIAELGRQEYLTFSKAAVLMGCSRQYVYKLVGQGKLRASRLSSRMAFIRKADIERMLDGSPYHRVIPCSAATYKRQNGNNVKHGKVKASDTRESGVAQKSAQNEPMEYYTGEEVMSLFKVNKSWLYTCAKRHQIPVCRISGRTYYAKRQVDECFGVAVDVSAITDWVTAEEVEQLYGMKDTALHAYVYRHRIPVKREYGRTYYSKTHIGELRRPDLMADDRYLTTEQVSERYGLTPSNIWHIAKVHHIRKTKVGVKNLLFKEDVERAMAERKAKGL